MALSKSILKINQVALANFYAVSMNLEALGLDPAVSGIESP